MKKKFIDEDVKAIIFWVIVIIVLEVCHWFLPLAGEYGMWHEIFQVLLVLMLSLIFVVPSIKYLFYKPKVNLEIDEKFRYKPKKKDVIKNKIILSLVIPVILIVNFFYVKNLVLDIYNGAQEIELTVVKMYIGKPRIRSREKYRLIGDDANGKRYSFLIDYSDYRAYEAGDEVIVRGYPHTEIAIDVYPK